MKLANKETITFIGILTVIILAFFYIALGFSGMMSVLGVALIFIFPTFLILNNFGLDTDEKIVFSFFIGTGIFPSIAYWLGTLISFKMSILITFIFLLIISSLIKKFYIFYRS
mgnify:CR=1 FL=1